MTTLEKKPSGQGDSRIRQEIERALDESDSWPSGLTPEAARKLRQWVKITAVGVLGVVEDLQSAAAASNDEALDDRVETARTLWDRDAARLGGSGWDRVAVWVALYIAYLFNVADARWPAPLRVWLQVANAALARMLPTLITAEIAARAEHGKPLPEDTAVPTLKSPPDAPPPAPADVADHSLMPDAGSRRFRGEEQAALESAPSSGAAPEPEARDDARRYDVWFGTNRIPGDNSTPSRAFGNERDPQGRVHYGSCSVEVPRTHKFGSTGTAWWKRWARFQFRDDHLRLVEVLPFADADEFFSELHSQMAEFEAPQRQALVYLHGYNVSFEEAAIRAAQIGFDLKVPGVTAFFSWPSADDTKGYFADQDRIEASETEIADFLTRTARETGAEAVHILAHSMGNRGLARAIQRITARAAEEGKVRFGQIILAAPDVSVELFRDLAAVYPALSERTTMYASARDRALAMSGFLQDGSRAGFTPPVTVVPGVDTVEVTDIDITMLGHGYYAEAEAVLYDMSQLLHSGLEPSRRPRLSAARSRSGEYWRIGA